jgi:hypothetical protein
MSPPGRPKGELRSAQHEATPVSEPLVQGIAAQDDRCPRCGGGFHCGVNDEAPCPCTSLTLAAATQAALRQRYSGCLCLRCLQLLRDEALMSPP